MYQFSPMYYQNAEIIKLSRYICVALTIFIYILTKYKNLKPLTR